MQNATVEGEGQRNLKDVLAYENTNEITDAGCGHPDIDLHRMFKQPGI